MRILFGLVVASLLAGCATSGYTEFYRPTPGATPDAVAQLRGGNPAPKVPPVVREGGDGHQVVAAYARKGYVIIGESSFNSGRDESLAAAQKQGERVGADLVVVLDPTYTGSRTANIPITTPTTQTSVTNGTATAYGPGGMATAYGNSTTTTYGSQTNWVPMTVNRYDYDALYYVKQTHFILGAGFRDLNDAERHALQSNRGAYVTNIVDGEPAFKADILVGDMIVALDQTPVYGYQGLQDALHQKHGQDVVLTIFRNGESITKSVRLND